MLSKRPFKPLLALVDSYQPPHCLRHTGQLHIGMLLQPSKYHTDYSYHQLVGFLIQVAMMSTASFSMPIKPCQC